jgi:predicted TIM-barrel fold metal-dependent hydrolase
MGTNEDWLGLVHEEALEPARPIIDPHHHLWERPGFTYSLDELLADTRSGHNVVATVFVECMAGYRTDGPEHLRPVGETDFVEAIAERSGGSRVAAGIVGFADLTLGAAVDEVLDAHEAASPRFRGIRHASGFDPHEDVRNSHTNPPSGLLGVPTFREGFKRLGARGMSFDAWLYHPQIPELTELARACPDVTIVLDHFGGPLGIGPYEGKRREIYARWKQDVAELARCPNVFAKIGGINMPVNGFDWHKRDAPPGSQELADATKDWYLHSIDCFGPDRCMFESNFPVDKASCSYAVLWNAFKRMAEPFSEQEKFAMFHDTAARVYRLS